MRCLHCGYMPKKLEGVQGVTATAVDPARCNCEKWSAYTTVRRPWERHFLNIALEVAAMGTCIRRQVGCVLVDSKRRILATGFNGVAPGAPHCNEGHECPGAHAPSGTNLDVCYANHSEINALLQCHDVWAIDTLYCTTSPCTSCIKAVMCTSTKRIVFLEEYPQPSAKDLWLRHGGVWVPYPAASS